MNTSPQEKAIKELFIGKCWEYLNNNFHKFTETNKIKIALELCKKDLPTHIEGENLGGDTKIIIVHPKEVTEREPIADRNNSIAI